MKTRMEKYHSGDITPQRVEKNTYLYDEIYSEKKEPTSNVTVLDNVNEIDINKIKSIINNREEYKKVKTYSNLIGREEKYCKEDLEFNFDEREPKDYDINEILKRKRSDKDSVIESEKIRKISNTQYDILKGLDLKHIDDDEMDTEFFTQEKELKSLISTITEKKEEEKTTTDFFKDLKGKDDEDLTPPKAIEENNINSIEDKDNTSFYSSKYSFAKDDFEDLEDLKKEVKKHNVTMKVLLVLIICIVIVAIVLLAINYIDFNSLLK